MNDLEERLRVDLIDAAEPATWDVDVDAVLSGGRRLRRSRVVRKVVAGLAVTVAVAGVWTGLAGRPVAGVPVLPAAPLPSEVLNAGTAHFDTRDRGLPASSTFESIEVTATRTDAARWHVTVVARPESGDDQLTAFETGLRPRGGAVTTRIAPQVQVVLIPDRVDSWSPVASSYSSGYGGDFMHLGGLDLSAALVTFDSEADADDFRGAVWLGRDGVVRSSDGRTIPSSEVVLSDRELTLYWDERQSAFGLFDASLTGGFTLVKDRPGGPFPAVQYWSPASGSTKLNTTVVADVLPSGASDVQARLASPTGEFTTTEVGGRIAFVALSMAEGQSDPVFTELSYRKADGKRFVFRP